MEKAPCIPVFVNVARRWLFQNDLTIQPSDKDGVMVVLSKYVFTDMLQKALDKKWYLRFDMSWIDAKCLRSQAFSLCDRMSKFVLPSIVHDIRYVLKNPKLSFLWQNEVYRENP